MDDRQKHFGPGSGNQVGATPDGYILSQRIRMVGWREHEALLTSGHYRCPCCRRTDTTEMYPADVARR